jgi:hypothetical protein
MTSKLITPEISSTDEPKLNKIYFKIDLPSKELMMGPEAIPVIIEIGKFLYDSFKKSKEGNNEQLGEWLTTANKKLDQILRDLEEIKNELKKIESLFGRIPLSISENNLDIEITKYYINVPSIRQNQNAANGGIFSGIYNVLQSAFIDIIGNGEFSYIYKLVLAFLIQYDILCAQGQTNGVKYQLIALLKSFLIRAKDETVDTSFGYILKIHKNTLTKLESDFRANNFKFSDSCILEKYITPSGGGEGNTSIAKIAKVAIQITISGTIDTEFTLTADNYIGPYEERTIAYRDAQNMQDENSVRGRLENQVQSHFNSFVNACLLHKEAVKNVDHFQSIIDDINHYLAELESLTQECDNLQNAL